MFQELRVTKTKSSFFFQNASLQLHDDLKPAGFVHIYMELKDFYVWKNELPFVSRGNSVSSCFV